MFSGHSTQEVRGGFVACVVMAWAPTEGVFNSDKVSMVVPLNPNPKGASNPKDGKW